MAKRIEYKDYDEFSTLKNPGLRPSQKAWDIHYQIADGLLTTIGSFLGLKPSIFHSQHPKVRDLTAMINSLGNDIVRNYEEKYSIMTPTTSAEYQLQSEINKIYSKYTQEAKEIMSLANQIETDSIALENKRDKALSGLSRKKYNFYGKQLNQDINKQFKEMKELQGKKNQVGEHVNKLIDTHQNKYQNALKNRRNNEK